MAFISFLGRLLFVSVFVLSAWQEFNEFGINGGSAAKTLAVKLPMFSEHFTTHTGFQVPEFEIKSLVAGAIALKGIGSLLFIFDNTIGAFLLILHQLIATPILYDFYNYDAEKKEFTQLFVKFTEVYTEESGAVRGTDVLHWDEDYHAKEISSGLIGVTQVRQ
ncbi:hypothetical protein L1987_63257 [Smallanthus sonchifolius]|uniref:Uncharacterized protein n=1 Tax=Smallanthus sonchifolius TaxID=185202 RepID=A0ACB9CCV4_9ASTR|nr:hypothetical protein L1987_63257 [Smallanthus sonchifolius]